MIIEGYLIEMSFKPDYTDFMAGGRPVYSDTSTINLEIGQANICGEVPYSRTRGNLVATKPRKFKIIIEEMT